MFYFTRRNHDLSPGQDETRRREVELCTSQSLDTGFLTPNERHQSNEDLSTSERAKYRQNSFSHRQIRLDEI